VNQALSQAESLFKAAITLIQEVPPMIGKTSIIPIVLSFDEEQLRPSVVLFLYMCVCLFGFAFF
jgi:hypothetical protein